MAIDPISEQLLSLSQAAKRLPHLRKDRPIAPSTLWRWASAGLRGVKLETVKVGGATCTSVEALSRFLAALNNQPPPIPTKCRVDHDEAVERELTKRGM
jgi:hypothetical protein